MAILEVPEIREQKSLRNLESVKIEINRRGYL